jgi:preprotein translocase subunit SecG
MTIATLETVLLLLLVADAIALAALVLLQQGKGADVGAAFGSGSANTVFGSAGSASFLTKLTAWLSIGFFVIAFGLAYTAKERAAAQSTLGIPQVPLSDDQASQTENLADEPADEPAEEELLTPEPESVDSDIPDL